jgi:hypothetical protein
MGAGKKLHPGTPLACTHHLLRNSSAGVESIGETSLAIPPKRKEFKMSALTSKFTLGIFTFASIFAPTNFLAPLFSTSQSPKSMPCSVPEYHQFDFWLGDWDSYDFGTTKKDARLRIDRILDGCVIHEDYESLAGHHGQSFSIYDASRKVWHQTWVTNRGELLIIEGQFRSGEMTLSGSDLTSTGQKREVRGVWKPLPDGSVRETAVTSLDSGKSWQPWFDLIFRPHRP